MLFNNLKSFLLLPAALRTAWAQNSTSSSSTACNNSPELCQRAYNNVTYLGAHDSPFVRDASTQYSTSGNQYYNSTVQLAAGVRLLTAQVQQTNSSTGGQLHVCHTSCDILDAGPLSDWLGEVRTWMESNTNDVVTLLLVNGAGASASDLADQYQQAGITTELAYTPSGTTSQSQQWPTLQSLINKGTRLMNFVATLSDNSAAPYLMNEFSYIFENQYDVTSPSDFSCEANRPSSVANNTAQAISNDMMPLMNHFLDEDAFLGIETPNDTYASTTNAPSGGVGNLGDAASECAQTYGRNPAYLLVDFFNVGPAIATVDRLNGVTDPVGRTTISSAAPQQTNSAGLLMPTSPLKLMTCLGALIFFVTL